MKSIVNKPGINVVNGFFGALSFIDFVIAKLDVRKFMMEFGEHIKGFDFLNTARDLAEEARVFIILMTSSLPEVIVVLIGLIFDIVVNNTRKKSLRKRRHRKY